jgi:prepilin-type processing-associated H-X9-DG protein
LVELLVVIAIIATLASFLLPALSRGNDRSQTAACLSNKRQLLAAWLLYAQDNQDRLVPNYPETPLKPSVGGWVDGRICWTGLWVGDNINAARLTGALLGPYAGRQARIYRCPTDRSRGYNQWAYRNRSVSMNAFVGNPGPGLPGPNYVFSGWKQFLLLPDLAQPSEIFVFLDEHPDTINDGFFVYCSAKRGPPETNEWSDLPASWHSRGGTFVFADGHAENHRWAGSTVLKPGVMNGAGNRPVPVPPKPAGEQGDIAWVRDHSTHKMK